MKLSQDQVSKYWDDLRAAIVSAVPPLAKADQAGLNTLLQGLLMDRMQAWALYELQGSEGKEIVKIYALVVTTVWQDLGTQSRSLLIYALYGYSFVSEDLWKGGLESLRRYAKSVGCERIVAYSRVARILEIVKGLGGDVETRLVTLEV